MEELKEGKGSKELLQAHALLWNHIFNHIDSMSIKCAVELGIPDAVYRHGRPITLPDLLSALSISPTKAPHLRRLMRMLTQLGFFRVDSDEDDAYCLTPLSRLLVTDHKDTSLSPFLLAMLHPVLVNPFHFMSAWFRGDEATPFSTAHGCGFWDKTDCDPEFNRVFNDGMASDAQFMMGVLLKECRHVFRGLSSLVDVGGGTGSVARAIAEAFPQLRCSVLELPQVVDSLPTEKGLVDFIAGDMFDRIPTTDAVLLKWILHDWNDDECVEILRRCKEAIPSKEAGGKVIIIDMVVGSDDSLQKSKETQLFMDTMMMALCPGSERGEDEWRKIFIEAGFTDYNITPALGLRSVIELYP